MMTNPQWKNHMVCINYPHLLTSKYVTVNDLPDTEQEYYLAMLQEQNLVPTEELSIDDDLLTKIDGDGFIPLINTDGYDEVKDAWQEYQEDFSVDEDSKLSPPYVDTWHWISPTYDKVILKDVYYLTYQGVTNGILLLKRGEKFIRVAINDGRNMVKIRDDTALHREFNTELAKFNKIRSIRVTFDPR